MSKTTLLRLLLVPALSFGCVFTSRPQLPAADGGLTSVEDTPGFLPDAPAYDSVPPPYDADRASDAALSDAGIPSPATDGGVDATASGGDAGGGETDFCRAAVRTTDAGADASLDASDGAVDDAGFFNSHGQPCDPETFDAGRDAGHDASDGDDDGGRATDAGAAADAAETSTTVPPADAESRG